MVAVADSKVGRLLHDGVITSAWFRRTVEQVALVNDPEVLAFIDAEVAHRLIQLGGLSALIVESAVAEVIAEYAPDALVLTREEVEAYSCGHRGLSSPTRDT